MTHAKIEAYYIAYLMIVALRGSKPVLPILRHEHTGNDGIYQSLSTGKSSLALHKLCLVHLLDKAGMLLHTGRKVPASA